MKLMSHEKNSRFSSRARVGLALCCMGLAGITESRHAARAPRLVLVYATCSVNKNYLAPYTPGVRYTPNLMAYARRGRVFARQQTEAGQSALGFASLWTGNQAMRTGVYASTDYLDEDNVTLAEVFAKNGFETHFWDHHNMASSALNFSQGVDAKHIFPRMLEGQDQALTAVLTRLNSSPRLRAFIMTNHTVTHRTYDVDRVEAFYGRFPEERAGLSLPEVMWAGQLFARENLDLSYSFEETVSRLKLNEIEVRRLIAGVELIYKSRIYVLDELFGTVLDAITKAGLLDESLIVFTSDHGEALYRKNALWKWTHGYMLGPDDLSVPLMMVGPGINPGVYQKVTRSIDLFPTVIRLAGLPRPIDEVMGSDLSEAVLGHGHEPDLTAFSHTELIPKVALEDMKALPRFHQLFPDIDIAGTWVAARRGDYVYKQRIAGSLEAGPEVYDWSIDPDEKQNLFDAKNPSHLAMLAQLRAYKGLLVAAYLQLPRNGNQLTDKEKMNRLRSLGYIRR